MKEVQELYDKVPFSTYDLDYFTVFKPLNKTKEELKQLFKDKRAIEVGCAAGHITAYLSGYFQSVTGVDLSENSIEQAKSEAKKRKINNVSYFKADIFDEKFLSENAGKFDFVLCYGVLHHTKDPALGFRNLTTLLKPGGLLTVGVYSRTELKYRLQRKIVLLLAGADLRKREELAKRLIFRGKGNELAISDGFVNPVVSFHSISGVMGWVRRNNLTYEGSFPPIEITRVPEVIHNKFIRRQGSISVNNKGKTGASSLLNHNPLSYLLVELLWSISGKSVMLSISSRKPE